MKAQRILNSFLPGVTAAVLTTQPAWADTVTVDNSHLGTYPSIFTTSTSSEDVLSDTFIPRKDTVDKTYPAPATPAGVESGNLKPVNPSAKVRVAPKSGVSNEAMGEIIKIQLVPWMLPIV